MADARTHGQKDGRRTDTGAKKIYTMHNKFSNCLVWVSPSTSDLKFHLLS